MKIKICSDASAVSGKPHLPAAWCAVLEWTEGGDQDPNESGENTMALSVAGYSPTSRPGVAGAELAGVLSGLIAVQYLQLEIPPSEISLDLHVDNAYVDRCARGVVSRPRPGNKSPTGRIGSMWKHFDSVASEFHSISIQWRPRNSLWGLSMADSISGRMRKGASKTFGGLDSIAPGVIHLVSASSLAAGPDDESAVEVTDINSAKSGVGTISR